MNLPETNEVSYFDVTEARNPYWTDSSYTRITLEVMFAWGADRNEYIPFTASPDDPELHGRQIFADAKAGKYGEVAPPPVPTAGQVENEISRRIKQASAVLSELSDRQATLQDALDLNMAGVDTHDALENLNAEMLAWREYRVKVSRVAEQDNYPQAVIWPEAPANR
ncbi:tail fiber assembly protein [Shimwellia pseudoproteus]|uniref:tail fiber assembly protein n=1 Tax=Shimwellia pseudoproteus TaxID=570012 RepID=UPI0018EB5058|nr:tail fiber assembly protein [Shimwellia pseudoproteus]MBJ3816652.1 tail fiber assembly protein [Shimwellia pseudoproteus]